jgi:rubrerythrin
MSDQSQRVMDIFEQYVCPVCTEESDDYIFCNIEEADLCPQCYKAKRPKLKGE